MTPLIRVLLVDDHSILRKGIRAVLSTEPDIEVVLVRLGASHSRILRPMIPGGIMS